MEENESLKDLLKEIAEGQKALIESGSVKPWKMPFKARVSKAQAKKGYATIIIIRNNGDMDFTKRLIKDGVVEVDGFPRVATINYKLSYRGKPVYIIPEWSLKPFSPAENYSETERDKMNIAGRRTVLSALQTDMIKPKKDMGKMIWIILAIVVVGGIWYFGKNAGWF